jgi:hypothetical protein
MLPEDNNTQTNEAGEDQIQRDKVIQKSWKDKDQKTEQDRQQRTDIDDH